MYAKNDNSTKIYNIKNADIKAKKIHNAILHKLQDYDFTMQYNHRRGRSHSHLCIRTAKHCSQSIVFHFPLAY